MRRRPQEDYGAKLTKMRAKYGVSLQDFSAMCGVAKKLLRLIEHSRFRVTLTLPTHRKIMRGLKRAERYHNRLKTSPTN